MTTKKAFMRVGFGQFTIEYASRSEAFRGMAAGTIQAMIRDAIVGLPDGDYWIGDFPLHVRHSIDYTLDSMGSTSTWSKPGHDVVSVSTPWPLDPKRYV